MDPRTIVVAFPRTAEGSALLAHLRAAGSERLVAVSVDAGGLGPGALELLKARAERLGANAHVGVEGRGEVHARYLTPLLRLDAWRAGADPLWLAAEDYAWADHLAAAARRERATVVALADGDEAALLRIACGLAAQAPDLELRTPLRGAPATMVAAAYAAAGEEPPEADGYRVRASAWAHEVSGAELDDPWQTPEEEAHPRGAPPWEAAELPEELDLGFSGGLPVEVSGAALDGVNLLEQLERIGRRHGVGRALRTCDAPLGGRSRAALEAPAAWIVREAHQALAGAVLSSEELRLGRELAAAYAELFWSGRAHDPALRAIEAFAAASQDRLSGTVRLRLYRGVVEAIGVRSEASVVGRSARAPRDVIALARALVGPRP